MATRMNPMAGRYFNSPQFAQAMSNLAGAFGPPSAQEMLTGAQYQGTMAQNSRLAQLWDMAGGDFDRSGVAAGLYTPNQSYYAVDQSNATTRRGQDIDANTRRYGFDVGAAADRDVARINQQGNFVNDRFNTPLNPGQTMPGIVGPEADFLNVLGLPTESLPARFGAPETLDPEELRARELMEMFAADPEIARAFALDGMETTQVTGPNGEPIYEFSGAAAAGNMPAYNNPGGRAAIEERIYVGPDNKQYRGYFDPVSGESRLADGSPVPPEFLPVKEVTGSMSGLGSATAENRYLEAEAQLDTIEAAVNQLEPFVDGQGGDVALTGLSGGIANVVNEAPQVLRELQMTLNNLGQGENIPLGADLAAAVESAEGMPYDPRIRQGRSLIFRLAAARAALTKNGGEVGTKDIERELEQLGQSGLLSSNEGINAILDEMRQTIANQRVVNQRSRERFSGGEPQTPLPGSAPAGAPAAPAANRPRATNPETGQVIEWDGSAWVPVQ